MASSQSQMGPPMLPAYSLRVQLFAPHAHSSSDKPIRCFRVVSTPEATVWGFCEEASRIHEINYGEPLAVKKVQDDLGFDVTQGEVVGNVFPNTSMIRIVQAAAVAGMRDSVPPSSALRFDPSSAGYQSRKRERDYSFGSDGLSPGRAESSNKRQRVLGINPDQPVSSREEDLHNRIAEYEVGRSQGDKVIADSQQTVSVNLQNGTAKALLDRTRVPETPPPSHGRTQLQNGSSIRSGRKLDDANHAHHAQPTAPKEETGNHLVNVTEDRSALPGGATSPNFVVPRAQSSMNKKSLTPIAPPPKVNGSASTKSLSEEAIYDDFASDSSVDEVLRRKKETPKLRSSLPGLGRENDRTRNTSPNRLRRKSSPRDHSAAHPGQLPLMPGSKECDNKERRKEAEEARSAKKAAADAAERRRLEAKRIQQEEEEARGAELLRQRQQDDEDEQRAGELRREEAGRAELRREIQEEQEAAELRQEELTREAEDERAAQLKKEKEATLERERRAAEKATKTKAAKDEADKLEEERHRVEKATKEKGDKDRAEERKKEESKRQAVEARAAQLKKQKEATLERQQRAAEKTAKEKAAKEKAEAQRVQRETEKLEAYKQQQEKQARERADRIAAEEEAQSLKRKASSESSQARSASPAVTRGTPSGRARFSTAFIPGGRKPALRTYGSSSSLSVTNSSPVLARVSPQVSGIDAAMPLPKDRRVSFTDEVQDSDKTPKSKVDSMASKKAASNGNLPVSTPRRETPVLPPTRNLPAGARIRTLVPAKPTDTPILPPKHTISAKIIPKMTSSQLAPPRKPSPATRSTPPRKSETPIEPRTDFRASSTPKSSSPPAGSIIVEISSDSESVSEYDEEDDEPQQDRQTSRSKSAEEATPRPLSIASQQLSVQTNKVMIEAKQDLEEDEETDDESPQQVSPERDSRSPIVHKAPTPPTTKQQSRREADTQSNEEMPNGVANQDEADGTSSSGSDAGAEVQITQSSSSIIPAVLRSGSLSKSSPKEAFTPPPSSLIRLSSQANNSRSRTTASTKGHRLPAQSHDSSSDSPDDAQMQDQLDSQLTSSMPQGTPAPARISSTPIPIPKSISQISTISRGTPELKVGASLSQLKLHNPIFGGKDKVGSGKGLKSGQLLKPVRTALGRVLGLDGSDSPEEEEEEEEEEDEDSESESESEDENDSADAEKAVKAINQARSAPPVAPPSKAKQEKPSAPAPAPASVTSTSGSGSGSGSDSDDADNDSSGSESESESEAQRVQRELREKIARVAEGILPAGVGSRIGVGNKEGKEGEEGEERTMKDKEEQKVKKTKKKSNGRIVSGYQFSLPSY